MNFEFRIPVRSKKLRIILYILSIILVVIGGSSFIKASTEASNISPPYKTSENLGLSQPKGIVVNNTGVIFCCSQGYSRVQVYNAKGDFLYAIKIDSGDGGDFHIDINSDYIMIATVRNDMMYKFDFDGTLISQENSPNGYDDIGEKNDYEYICNNVEYRIENSIFFPQISSRNHYEKKIIIVPEPLNKWIFTGPLPGWIFAAIGIIIFAGLINNGNPSPGSYNEKKNFT